MGNVLGILGFSSASFHQILKGTDNPLKSVRATGKGFIYVQLSQLAITVVSHIQSLILAKPEPEEVLHLKWSSLTFLQLL